MLLFVLHALGAYFPIIPVEKHTTLFYSGLATIFVFVLGYMFVYTKRH